MREILFRGKREITEEWVYGYYYKAKYYRAEPELYDYISVPHPESNNAPSEHISVIPETVGQYTGLTDKNGKKIFEGDIMIHLNNSPYADGSISEIGCVFWDVECCGWCRTSNGRRDKGMYRVSKRCCYEVIGNIHDNPELLGGADGGN